MISRSRGRTGLPPGRFEVLPGAVKVAGAPVELAERGVEQVIVPQGGILAGFVQCANARVRTFDLGHDDRPVEQVHRRAMNREQGVVEAQDRRPIRFGIARRPSNDGRRCPLPDETGRRRSPRPTGPETPARAGSAAGPTCARSCSSMSRTEPLIDRAGRPGGRRGTASGP